MSKIQGDDRGLQFGNVWQGLTGTSEGCPPELAAQPVTSVGIDSRAVTPGALFIALRGERTDGHAYLQDAFDRGAIAAIAERRGIADCGLQISDYYIVDCTIPQVEHPLQRDARNPKAVFVVPDSLAGLQKLAAYWRAQMPAVAVGITGSVGKTTTKETVANVLARRFVTLRSEGNLNNEIGLPLTLLRLTLEHERVVLEMGMYALGEIAHLCELARPRIGLVTNVGPAHLERLGSIERIAQAKAELLQALPPADEGGVAILNADDLLVRAMAGLTKAQVFTYGLNPASRLWADEISSEGLEGIHFRLHYGQEAFHLHLPMLGRHSVHTALRGAAVGLIEGLSWTDIIAGLEEAPRGGQLRLMVVPGLRETTLIDDTYNASPESMLAALNLLEDLAQEPGGQRTRASSDAKHPLHPPLEAQRAGVEQRNVAVLGDMFELGSYEEEGHRLVGGRAAQVLGPASGRHTPGKLVTVGQRARWIAEEALAGGMKPADVHAVETNADAIAVLQGLIRSGDIVLIKGSRAAAMESIVDALSRPRQAGGHRTRPSEG